MNIPISIELLKKIEVEPLTSPVENNLWYREPGKGDYYRLLSHLSTFFNNETIFDIGSSIGFSALALSYNKNVKVKSLDITPLAVHGVGKSNIEFAIEDYKTSNALQREIRKSRFIYFDIDPHNGEDEIDFYKFLVRHNWKGITIWDDIVFNDQMKNFWASVTHNKIDLSRYGHVWGTGCIIFGDDITLTLE
jgi:predicted O-methyltransferase YrrM